MLFLPKTTSHKRSMQTTRLGYAMSAATLVLAIGLPEASLADGTPDCNAGVGPGGSNTPLECGVNATARGQDAVAVGANAEAMAGEAIAVGFLAGAKALSAIAVGARADAAATDAIAVGRSAKATVLQAIAVGALAEATAHQAIAVGAGAEATAYQAIAVGHNADATFTSSISIGGDGDDADVDGAQATADDAMALGVDARASATDTIALGHEASAGGERAIAIGAQTSTGTGNNGIAIGFNVSIAGNNSTAVGYASSADGSSASAIGAGASASGNNTSALGRLATASGPSAFAAGLSANASGQASSAFGANSVASGMSSTAMGRGAQATAINAMAIGRNAVSDVADQITIGTAIASYKFAGLAGTGNRTVMVDASGNLFTETAATAKFSADQAAVSSSEEAFATTRTAERSTVAGSDLEALTALVESLVQRVETLEVQLDEANDALATAGITSVAPRQLSIYQLQESGIEVHEAETIVALNEQTETQLLALRDSAAREGWLMSDAYHQRRTELLTMENPLRKTLGDDEYHDYLQKTEQTSQIEVESVFSDSAAQQAGIVAGDVIESYNGQRIFSSAELQLLTAQGNSSEQVDITVLRDGMPVSLYINRGPLGVATSSVGNQTTLLANDTTGYLPRAL